MELVQAIATAKRRAKTQDDERYIILDDDSDYQVCTESELDTYYSGNKVIYLVSPGGELIC